VAWEIEVTTEFRDWFAGLSARERVAIARKVDVLEERGPDLGRPEVDTLKGSRFPNMKELRIQHGGAPYRVALAFDPRRVAILLIGGRKGPKKWYRKFIATADRLYAEYLEELKKEDLI
jgi:hypothetical protein